MGEEQVLAVDVQAEEDFYLNALNLSCQEMESSKQLGMWMWRDS